MDTPKPALKELTRAEEEVMQVLWDKGRAFAREVLEEINSLRPAKDALAYNTISTIIRILEEKGFVGHEAYGKTHQYYPLVEKGNYSNFFLKNFMGKYFGGSFTSMVSFFVQQNNLDLREFEQLLKETQAETPDTAAEDTPPTP